MSKSLWPPPLARARQESRSITGSRSGVSPLPSTSWWVSLRQPAGHFRAGGSSIPGPAFDAQAAQERAAGPQGYPTPQAAPAGGSCARYGARDAQGHRSRDQHRDSFPFTNLRGRVAQAKMPGVTVPASVMSLARGSTNRSQTRVASSRSAEVYQRLPRTGRAKTRRRCSSRVANPAAWPCQVRPVEILVSYNFPPSAHGSFGCWSAARGEWFCRPRPWRASENARRHGAGERQEPGARLHQSVPDARGE